MRYSRTFPPLDDLCFFEFNPDTATPSEADNNMGDEAFIRAIEVEFIEPEHIDLKAIK